MIQFPHLEYRKEKTDMAIYSYFFNAKQIDGEYDRTYTAEDMTSYLDGIVGSGVFPTPSDCLQVYAGTGMNVLVHPGMGWIEGHKILNTADLELAIDPADVTLNRIDRVVFRVNVENREMEIVVKKGTNASSPSAPEIVRDQDVIEYSLATITVNRNTQAITDAMIRDTRPDSSVCGFVQGIIQQVGTETLFKQWTAAFDQQYEEYTEEFNTWFEDIRENLKDVVMWQEYKNVVVTANDNVKTVNIGIPEYNRDLDILNVYVNGLRLDDTEYTATETKVTFTRAMDVKGTTIEFVVYKSVNASDAMTVAAEVQQHEERINKLESKENEYIYECTGEDDNKKISQIAQDFLNGQGDYVGVGLNDELTIRIKGKISTLKEEDAFVGEGTEEKPYIYFAIGKYNNEETGEDSTQSERKITFDFENCEQVNLRVLNSEKRVVLIGGSEANVRNLRAEISGQGSERNWTNGENVRFTECSMSITGMGKAIGATSGGTFERCKLRVEITTPQEACALKTDGTTPLKAIDCYILSYVIGTGGESCGIWGADSDSSVVIAERCNMPLVSYSGYKQDKTIKIEGGYCSLVSNILFAATDKYSDGRECTETGTMIVSKPI